MKCIQIGPVILLFMTTTLLGAEIDVKPGKQTEHKINITVGSADDDGQMSIPYLAFVPDGYSDSEQRWPLLLFLHGLGESGDGNLELVKKHGPPKKVERQADFPFIVISPQCRRPTRHFAYGWNADALIKLVDHVVAQLRVDPARIYVTGLSMGGYGTWRLAAAYPQRFAAAVPICGGGDPGQAAQLSKLPIWCFHGAKDNAVPLTESEKMVNAVNAADGNVKLTVYPDAGHDSWTRTYDNPALYQWLLAQRRNDKDATPGEQ